MKKPIIVKDKQHLQDLIKKEINRHGNQCDLNHLDISRVNDLSFLFYKLPFNGDISGWNVSNVTDMKLMFSQSSFNGDLIDWLPYKLEDKRYMFDNCSAPTPYWYFYDNVSKSINANQLKNKLEDKLSDINKSVKKIKI